MSADEINEKIMSNNEFFTLLLNSKDLKEKVLGAFKHSVYEELRKKE